MSMRPELIDELLKDCSDPREVLAEGGLIKQLTKAIIQRCLETELAVHLGSPNMVSAAREAPIHATGAAARRSKERRARSRLRCRAIGRPALSHSSSASIRPA